MEQLIRELVNPTSRWSPQKIRKLEQEIQQLQRAKEGWSVGFELLQSEEPQIRFYGALTLTTKISNDWDQDGLAHDEQARDVLLRKLVDSYAMLTNALDGPLVLQKLCSTLVAYIIQPSVMWQDMVRCLLVEILHHGSADQRQHLALADNKSLGMLDLLKTISFYQLRAILWFCSVLVEGAQRADLNDVQSAVISERIIENAGPVWQLLHLTLQTLLIRVGVLDTSTMMAAEVGAAIYDDQLVHLVKDLALPTACAWMKFAEPAAYETTACTKTNIEDVLSMIVAFVKIPFTAEVGMEVLTDLAQSAPRYFAKIERTALHEILDSQQAADWVGLLQSGAYNSDAMHYAELLLCLVELEDLSSDKYINENKLDSAIRDLQSLLQCQGTAAIEDVVCPIVLDAFAQIAEGFADWVGTSPANDAVKNAISLACGHCLVKIRYPRRYRSDTALEWDGDDRMKFQEFRRDVEDFLLSAFSSLGSPLLQEITNSTLSTGGIYNHTRDGWQAFEAGLFCLAALSDTMADNLPRYDSIVDSIFDSPQFYTVISGGLPGFDRLCVLRQCMIRYTSRNTGYLHRHPSRLLPLSDFLFLSLKLEPLATSASKAIQNLCHKQRMTLVPALPRFLTILESLDLPEPEDKHRLFSAVGAIIQALPDESAKVTPLGKLVGIIKTALEVASRASSASTEQPPLVSTELLRSLAAVGKGLRAPTEIINLDDDSSNSEDKQFWQTGLGLQFQHSILQTVHDALIQVPRKLRDDALVEAYCDFLRVGYTEEHPSPFKFPPEPSTWFYANNMTNSTPRISHVFATASAFLASIDINEPDVIEPIIAAVVNTQCSIITSYQQTLQYWDHDFTNASLDFLARLLPRWCRRWLLTPNAGTELQVILKFALLSLENPDTLPRRSAASFWAALLDLSGYPTDLSGPALDIITAAVRTYAGQLAAVLVRLLGGECTRAEIYVLCEPLKRLVSKHGVLARQYLRAVMDADAGVLSEKAIQATEPAVRTRFAAQVDGLRGGRKTVEVVREFWVACRGAAFV